MIDEGRLAVVEWDGKPIHLFTPSELLSLYALVPQWHGVAEGPLIPFVGVRARVAVNCIFLPTREAAEVALWAHIRAACASENMIFNEDDWTIMSLHCINCG